MVAERSRSLFLPVLLIGAGVLYAAEQIGIINFMLDDMLRFGWPLLIVGYGITLIIGRHRPWIGGAAAIGVLAGALLASTITNNLHPRTSFAHAEPRLFPLHGYGQSTIIIDGQSVNLAIDELDDDGEHLLAMPSGGEHLQMRHLENGSSQVMIKSDEQHPRGSRFQSNNWELELTSLVELKLELALDSANAELDLEELNIPILDGEINASSLDLKLSSVANLSKATLAINSSNAKIELPEETGIKLIINNSDSNLDLELDLEEGFYRDGNTYYSHDWESNYKQLELILDLNSSQVEIR